jgi:hypothetical protein
MIAVLVGMVIVWALDALVIVVAHLVDPGAPVLYISNLAAVLIGGIQLLYGVPLILILRRRRPPVALGVGLGMAAVLVVNAIALYR